MGAQRAEIVPAPVVTVSAVVTGIRLKLEERFRRVILMGSLVAKGALGRVQFRRWLRHQHRLRIRHLLLGEQFRLRLDSKKVLLAGQDGYGSCK